ncbi:MAG: hypothetical protein IPG04_41870 [Polyangiaceae bacterium]|nr:hypothetical protein [Polyangiaceae bacterium]
MLSRPALGFPYGEACSVESAALAEQPPLGPPPGGAVVPGAAPQRRFVADFPGAIG